MEDKPSISDDGYDDDGNYYGPPYDREAARADSLAWTESLARTIRFCDEKLAEQQAEREAGGCPDRSIHISEIIGIEAYEAFKAAHAKPKSRGGKKSRAAKQEPGLFSNLTDDDDSPAQVRGDGD